MTLLRPSRDCKHLLCKHKDSLYRAHITTTTRTAQHMRFRHYSLTLKHFKSKTVTIYLSVTPAPRPPPTTTVPSKTACSLCRTKDFSWNFPLWLLFHC